MKTRNTTTKLIAAVIALGTVAAICGNWGAIRTEAVPRDCGSCGVHSGMFGVARGQTARINVVNTGEERGFIIDGGKFLDSDGNTLAEFERTPLAVGHAATFEFMPRDLAEGQRLGVRVVLMFEGTSRNRNQPGLITTLEVYDIDTGKTTFGFIPPPDPD